MPVDYLSPAVTVVGNHIAASAILKEAGRLAGDNSTNPNVITQKNIDQAAEAYKKALEAARR